MKKYFNHQVKKIVTVKNLITIEYLDISRGFSYPEEVHDFHEFAYIDSGIALGDIVEIDVRGKRLKAKLVKEHMDQKNPPYGRALV